MMTTKRYFSSLQDDLLDVGVGRREHELTSLVITSPEGVRTTVYLDRHDALDLARAILDGYSGPQGAHH